MAIDSRALFTMLFAAVALQRLIETGVSRRHARALLERGAVEAGRGHLGAMIALHVAFIVAAPLEVFLLHRPFRGWLAAACLAIFFSAQVLRLWTIRTLGERWSIRVLALPGSEPVTTGPFRWLRHPNYLAVAAELVSLPLVHGAWLTAVSFSLSNAALLAVRIRCEEQLLSAVGGYGEYREEKARFVPSRRRGQGGVRRRGPRRRGGISGGTNG